MSILTNLPNAVRARYEEKYIQSAIMHRLYDQFAMPASTDKEKLQRNSSIVLNFLSDMKINANTISEVSDIVPQALKDATVSVSGTSRGDAIQDSEALLIQSYTPYAAERYEKVGKNMMLTVDQLAQETMLQGALVDRATARASLDAGTAGHRLSDADLAKVETRLDAKEEPQPGRPKELDKMVHTVLLTGLP